MFRSWIRRKLREFLNEEKSVTRELDVIESTRHGRVKRSYLIVGASRLSLVGSSIDGGDNSTRNISAHEAIDQDKFWDIWQSINPKGKVTWEDGTPLRS